MTSNVSDTLAERGQRYGAFKDHASIAQGLQEVLWESPGWYRLQPDVRQMCVVITDKIARILNGDPDYTDNYHDIQGYAKLVEDRLLKEQKEQKGELFEAPSEEDELERETREEHPFGGRASNNFDGAPISHGDKFNVVEPVNGDWEAVGNYRG